jgi:stage II sporulation protein D
MRTGPRLLFAALVAGTLAVSGPAAQAKGGSSGKKPTSSTKAPKGPSLVTDVARIEPLPLAGAAAAPTVTLEGVGEYRGILEVRRAGAGVGAVNEVALDDYVKGIAEVPSSWPPEVLRAQAIAARTYLLWVLGNAPSGEAAALGAQICATDSCQVYSGVAKERAPNGDKWAAAVRDTAGLVLLSGGAPILAKYSACNGGRSVSGGKPYLPAVDDPDDARCPLSRWGLAVSYDDLGRALAVPGTVKAVRATAGDVSLDWVGDGGGGHLTVPRTEFRAKVGAAVPPPPDRSKTVPSILFTVRPDDAGRVATLDGRGYGHGIGMSQWGAYGKALRGMKAGAILAAYYGGIQPSKVPAAKLPARVRVAVDDGKPAPSPGPKPPPGPGNAPPPGAAPPAAATAKAAARPGAQPPPGATDATVSASGPFRMLDSKGNVIVPVATGTWKVVAAAKGVRLLPPRDQSGAPGLSVLGIEPAVPLPGQPLTVRFRSNLPAIVSATAQPPGGPAAPVLAPQVVGGEERRLTLPAPAQPGTYSLTLNADAGPGRTASVTVTPTVADPAAPPPAPGDSTDGGLLGLPPGVRTIPGGTGQVLLAGDMLSALAVDPPEAPPGDRPAAPTRASRSSALRPVGAVRAPVVPATSDRYGLGLLLAGLAGFALWRFRARPSS